MAEGIIFDIQRNSFVDGPGIRTTVFFKGCKLRCRWCHNPESWSSKPELMVYPVRCSLCGACSEVKCSLEREKCTACGKCADACLYDARLIAGKTFSTQEVMKIILRDKPFYESSGGGVTFSGGEPFLQPDFLKSLCTACKNEGIHTAIDTAGFIKREIIEPFIKLADLFLYDLKIWNSDEHVKWTGVPNELIISNLKKLDEKGANIHVRIPVIKGVNDSITEMQKVAEFLSALTSVKKVELLPYHAMGQSKSTALERKLNTELFPPDEKRMTELNNLFKK